VKTPATTTAVPKPNPAAVAAASAAVTKAKPREQRISALTEGQIMEKLRSVVTHADPNQSYTKIKKVGQGASGSVYVARYTGSIPLRTRGGVNVAGGSKVAIKQMDLANQPRKELIVNEILVMKESQHGNIVNFLDSYLVRGSELWVVMEFMEGGALTDVIDHNTLSEDQISCICLEVPQSRSSLFFGFLLVCEANFGRLARDSNIYTARTLSTAT
jgi:serine/threonine-protein kinase CLA4